MANKLTNVQFECLFGLQDGRPCRCSYGNPTHSALMRRGFVSIRHISRRDYLMTITAAGLEAVTEAVSRKTKQRSTLHT